MKPLLLVALLCASAWSDSLLRFRTLDEIAYDSWVRGEISYRECLDRRLYHIVKACSLFVYSNGLRISPLYTPADKLAALHVWRHCTGYGMKWEYFVWPNNNPIYVWYSCPDIACQWREVRP